MSLYLQELLLSSYYGPTGLDYTLGRLNMGGCDFSTRPYTYCDVEDPDLNQFSLTEDDLVYKVIFPYICLTLLSMFNITS